MAESQPSGRPPWWRRAWRWLTGLGRVPWWFPLAVLGLIILLAYSVAAITVLPEWVLSWSPTQDKDRVKAITDTRGALLGVLATVVVGIGAIAAFLNYRETQRQNRETLDLARRGQLTERFTKAIDQLGNNNLDIRLGGIYALERIAQESNELHGPVMEILTAFLREHSRKPKGTSAKLAENQASAPTLSDSAPNDQTAPLRADFQAIATVLGRRLVSHDPDSFRLDFRGVALGRVDFSHGQLREADFRGAQLHWANFKEAQLQGATFFEAQLERATFDHAEFQGGEFADAKLEAAKFVGARLEGANFFRAELKWAGFIGARLQGAKFFSAELTETNFRDAQLEGAGFLGAKLQGANFAEAQLAKANLQSAQLQGAKFDGAQLQGATFKGAVGLTPTQFDLALNVDKAILPDYLTKAAESQPDASAAE